MRQFFTLLFLSLSIYLTAQSIQLTPVLTGIPWLIGAKVAGDHQMYIIRQNGYINRFQGVNTLSATFLDWNARIKLNGEQGLLGVAFHPNYETNGFFYLFYSRKETGESVLSRMSRSAADPAVADTSTEKVLLTFPHPEANHVGGSLEFGPDGYLYLSIGDGGSQGDPNDYGQNKGKFYGKILRIDIDNGTPYAIPSGNPFIGQAGALPEIYAVGLRNPWRITFDRMTGDLWIADVGQDKWEEIDFIESGSDGGQNFGWSCMEGNHAYKACSGTPGLLPPAYEYAHTGGNCSGSITGGYVYRGYQYADLFGKYIFTDYCTGVISALEKDGSSATASNLGNFTASDYVSFVQDEAGELYIAGYNSNKLFRIKSNDCRPVAFIQETEPVIPGCDTTAVPFKLAAYGGAVSGMTFQWRKDNADIPGANGYALEGNQQGNYDVVVTNPASGCSMVSAPFPVHVFSSYALIYDETAELGSVAYGQLITGDITITLNFSSINGCDSIETHHITAVVATDEATAASANVKITPNPGSDIFEITGLPLNTAFRIVDPYGKIIQENQVGEKAVVTVSLKGKPAGVYYLAGRNIRKQLIKI